MRIFPVKILFFISNPFHSIAMKRLLTLLCTLTAIIVQVQEIKLRYNDKTHDLPDVMQQYFAMQDIRHMSVSINGDFDGKRLRLKKVACNDGKFTEREMLPDFIHFVFTDSIETLDFMAIPYGTDSLRITCFYPDSYNYTIFNDTVPAGPMRILMETYTPGDGADTPIMAYTTGIPLKGGNGTYYCGLRSSGVDPWKWHEKYGIDDYVFYTVRIEDDTRPDPNAPIYIKIHK